MKQMQLNADIRIKMRTKSPQAHSLRSKRHNKMMSCKEQIQHLQNELDLMACVIECFLKDSYFVLTLRSPASVSRVRPLKMIKRHD